MEKIFFENGLVAYWIAKLALICRNRMELTLKEKPWHSDYRSNHWLGLLLPYFERKKKTFLINDEAEGHHVNVRAFFEGLYELLPDFKAGSSSYDPVLKENLEIFSEALGLEEKEKNFLTFVVLSATDPQFEHFLGEIGEMPLNSALRCLARLFELPLGDFYQILTSGHLVSGNILTAEIWRSGKVSLNNLFEIDDLLFYRLFIRHRDRWEFFSNYFRRASSSVLPLERFSHLSELGILTGYLEQVLLEKRPGVNVLLYGPPGTGKTELAKALAAHLRADLFEVAFLKPSFGALTPAERLAALFVAQRLLSSNKERSFILVDEAEDIMVKENYLGLLMKINAVPPSKIQLNHFLGSNQLPVIWIVNTLSPRPRVWWLPLTLWNPSATWKRSFPLHYRLWRKTLSQSVKMSPTPPFNAQVLNTSPCIEEIYALTNSSYPARLLFYGPSGSGKTELAHRIAERMGRPLLVRNASDLFSSYVGKTERAITDMFREAENKEAVLLLDEVDTFLHTRREARYSWEITWVNEMLISKERYQGCLICTTNHVEILDDATARRFDLKVEFRPMDPARA
ncbi:MAG: AAA family ATPase [Deltaproteobacteria bacterium]